MRRMLVISMPILALVMSGAAIVASAQEPKRDEPARPAKKEPQRWALLVGVDDYVSLNKLQYCGADQVALHERLIDAGFPKDHLFLLHDQAKENRFKPFKANIEKELKLLLSLVGKDDLIIVSFSGHGLQIGPSAYLCPADADFEKTETLVSMTNVYEQLNAAPAALRLMIVDACRDDPRARGKRSAAKIEELTEFAKARPPDGILWWGSCGPGQKSQEDDVFKHGVFMHFVLEGWEGKADANSDGKVTLGELSDYAGTETKKHVARKFADFQSPFLKGEYDQELLRFSIGNASNGPARPGKTITNSIGMKLSLIPAGEFLMGSSDAEKDRSDDEKQHRVKITKPFYLGNYHVTRGQFGQFVAAERYKTEGEKDGKGAYGWDAKAEKFEQKPEYTWRNTGFAQTDEHPVVNISWNDAVAFCDWLSKKEGKTYRLPTEAEWEYACRAGTTTTFNFGTALNGTQANCDGNYPYGTTTKGAYVKGTTQVGSYKANAFGLYDMHGNAWQWCADWYDKDYYGTAPAGVDPQGPNTGERRVLRGGSWSNDARDCRAADRLDFTPGGRSSNVGFRVVVPAARTP